MINNCSQKELKYQYTLFEKCSSRLAMSVYQQVLDFLKARGGVVNLRELRQFPNTILDTLHLHQYIEIRGRVGFHQVCLICDEFDAKDEKAKQPTKVIVKPKESLDSPKKPKVSPQVKATDNIRLERCKQIRDSILNEIKTANKPMSAWELKEKFPYLKSRAIAYHLKKLENTDLVCSVDWNTRLWTDTERKDLLQQIVGTYIGRYDNKNAVLDVLKNADEAMSVASILRKLQNRCSGTTLRKILELFIMAGVVRAGHFVKSGVIYYARIDNQVASSHLHQLTKYKKRKLKSQV